MACLNSLLKQLTKATNVSNREIIQSDLRLRFSLLEVFIHTANYKCLQERRTTLAAVISLMNESPREWLCNLVTAAKSSNLQTIICDCMETIIGFGVTEFRDREHFTFETEDFAGVPQTTSIVFRMFLKILQFADWPDSDPHVRCFLLLFLHSLLALLAVHQGEHLWTNPDTIDLAGELLGKLCLLYDCETIEQFLQMDLSNTHTEMGPAEVDTPNVNILAVAIFNTLKARLCRDTWRRNPMAKASFVWTLDRVKFPQLSTCLSLVLPPGLLFVDDYMVDNKVVGIRCLHHIIDNVSHEELCWHGRANVIYDAIKHQLYTRELPLVRVVHPALLAILHVVEKSPEKPGVLSPSGVVSTRCVSKYDEVLQMILQDAEGEAQIHLRRAYTEHLATFIDGMGVAVVRHMKRLVRVIVSYLEICDGPEESARIHILQTLHILIRVAWPRMEQHTHVLLKSLVKLVCDMQSVDDTRTPQLVKDNLVAMTTRCLILLKFANKGSGVFEAMLQAVLDAGTIDQCKVMVQTVMTASSPTD